MIRTIGALFLLAMLSFGSPAAHAQNSTFIPFFSFAAGFLNQGVFPTSDNYTTDDDIVITAHDGVEIAANIFVPNNLGGLAPAVIFINSFGLNEYEYLTQAAQLAERGYIVLSYSTRGFGQSGGLINMAGPNDISDLGKVIDYLVANYPVNPNAIGSAGISYGAGISLIGAGLEPRLKAVASLSGWADSIESFYGNSSPHVAWADLVGFAGPLTGNPDPVNGFEPIWEILVNHRIEDLPFAREWSAIRSAKSYINEINTNNTAVYVSHNYGDNLFQPNQMLNFFSQLTSPKFLTMQPGTHGTAELLPPLTGLGDNYIFEDMYRWFDIHLKGEENALSYAQPVQMQVKFENYFQSTSAFPVPEAQDAVFYMHPRRWFDIGDLETYAYSGRNYDNTILGGTGSLFTTAIPLLSTLLEQFDIPVTSAIPLSSPFHSIYYQTAKQNNGMKIRGKPNVKLQLKTRSEAVQVVAYLYDMNAFGIGTLITHGVYTIPNATPGEKVTLDFDLQAIAYDVPPGNRVVVAFDTRDLQYGNPASGSYYLDFEYSKDAQSVLTIPKL